MFTCANTVVNDDTGLGYYMRNVSATYVNFPPHYVIRCVDQFGGSDRKHPESFWSSSFVIKDDSKITPTDLSWKPIATETRGLTELFGPPRVSIRPLSIPTSGAIDS
jgi:hypothetical protein